MLRKLSVLAVLFLLPLALFAQAQPAVPGAFLQYVEDEDQIQVFEGTKQITPVTMGMELRPGMKVKTLSSTAEIQLKPNGTVIKLAANTDFAVTSVQGRDSAPVNSFTLNAGRLRTIAARATGSRYEVRSPTAVCGVRGTDFLMDAVAGARDAVFVREGAVEFANAAGQALSIGAGQFADTFAASFSAGQMSLEQMAGVFAGMDFVNVTPPANVPVSATPAPGESSASPSATPAPTPTPDNPVMDFLREYMGMEIGSVTINGTTYSKAVIQPRIILPKFKAQFYLPIIYSGDLFNPNDWYKPEGNSEWSFGTDKNWNTEPLAVVADIWEDLVLKIKFVEIGEQRDTFFLKLGNLSTMTIGHGSLMRNFANDADFPSVRRAGINTGINTDNIGVEAVVNDLGDPEIFGGRFVLRPFAPGFRLGFGVSSVIDIDPASQLASTVSGVYRNAAPVFIGLGADLDLPILEKNDFLSIILFADASVLLPYLRNPLSNSALAQNSGFIFGALAYNAGSNPGFRNYGIQAGVFGNVLFLDYRLEFRQFHGMYKPAFFGPTYERTRGQEVINLVNYMINPGSTTYDKMVLGVHGEAGFTLLEKIKLTGAYFWPWSIDASGNYVSSDDDHLLLFLEIKKGLIPINPWKRASLAIGYERTKFIPTLLGTATGLSLFDANTSLTGEIIYPLGDMVDLAIVVSTAVKRNSDGTIVSDAAGNPEWAPVFAIETRVTF